MFTKEELSAIVGLMDVGIKGAGLQAMRPEVMSALEKLQQLANDLQKGNGIDKQIGATDA